MALEYRLSGPRTGDSLTPSAISSKTKGLAGLFAGKRRSSPASTILVIARNDGAVAIEGGADAAASALSETYWTPVVFHFRDLGAAEAVLSGARRRLANERRDESDFWFLDMSAGQVAAAIKTEAKGLYSFEVIHPHLSDAPIVRADKRSWAKRAAGVAPYAIAMLAAGVVGLIVGLALKGF